jgi:hypothetical protein
MSYGHLQYFPATPSDLPKKEHKVGVAGRDIPQGTTGLRHPSGWVQLEIFTKWLHFTVNVKASPDDNLLLVLYVKKNYAILVRCRCETSRFPYFLDNRCTDGGKVVSLTRWPPFTPRKIHGTHLLVSRPQGHNMAGRIRLTEKSNDFNGELNPLPSGL